MSDTHHDAVVIGGGVSGLVASAYLAKTGLRVLLLEAEDILGGACRAPSSLAGVRATLGAHVLHALDPRVVKELGLTRRGLKFAIRDMPTVSLKQGGTPLLLRRDAHAAARAIAMYSPRDAEAYKRYHAEMFALGRAMRPWWWEDAPPPLRMSDVLQRQAFAQLEATSAAAMLGGKFESDSLKATLAFDALSPFEPGSALAFVWRAAQEMCGLQGALAVPQGGAAMLAEQLASAAQEAGVEVRTRARVARLILAGNMAAGVELETGEAIFARAVLSSLSRGKTLLDLAPDASAGFDETFVLRRTAGHTADATILFLLNAAPGFGGKDVPATSRFVIADRMESYAANPAVVPGNRLPDELAMEIVVPTCADPGLAPTGQHLVSVRVRGLPLDLVKGWPAASKALAERVVAVLEPHTIHLRERIIGVEICPPVAVSGFSRARITSSYAGRIGTPIDGLFLCGAAAEPVDAISGRAGRIAASIAGGWLAREKRA